ncbi:dihydroorotate dehydrogenase [Levilactobacillus suantsaii]|uniref:dihydroorotate dehydrogenase n=1 Tax=Levilactobacillus suantsaii TaxID=2292255 RepID=UPI0015F6A65F|nr:dihydroorotate dehydrogenase [Levilactobacillus suantsaii]QMU09111.1 dihydroorotate dehydrogenase [Levilactobacillus suantsaii]
MGRLSIQLAGVPLQNPVMPASGTAAYGQEMAQDLALDQLGAFVIKSTTQDPRAGNPAPTTAQTSGGWLNAIGLKNPGVTTVMTEKLPWLATHYPDLPVMGSIAGATFAEYVAVAQQVASAPNVKWLELNISCPNVERGGLVFGTDPHTVETLTRQVTDAVTKPVFVKLTPNVTDIVPIAQAAEAGGAAGLTLINTLTGLGYDLTTRKPLLAHGTGGLSGKAIHPLAVRMVHQVRRHTQLPIIGVGGVFTPEDVLEFYLAGANAVQIGAATYGNPTACVDIIDQLPAVMDRYHVASLQELIDSVQR